LVAGMKVYLRINRVGATTGVYLNKELALSQCNYDEYVTEWDVTEK
jgi:hypothetical protein